MRASRTIAVLGCLLTLAFAAPAAAVTITEFPIEPGSPPTAHAPRYIESGPDRNLWFTDNPGIGRIGPNGERFAPILDPHYPVDLATAADGTVYWTADDGLGRRLPNGDVQTQYIVSDAYAIAFTAAGELRWTERYLPVAGAPGVVCRHTAGWPTRGSLITFGGDSSRYTGLTLGPDGRLWAAAYEANRLRRLTADGNDMDLAVDLPVGSGPVRLAVGPDGNLWVTMFDASAIDRFTPAGERTRFPLPPGAGPNDIVVGPDGALWFTEYYGNKIGRMTTAGVLTNEFPIPTANARPIGIAAGPDGGLWFTESATGIIGRLRLDPVQAGGPGGGGGGGGAVTDRLAPRFVRLPALTPSRFRVPGGSRLSFELSEAATVTLTIARRKTGRRVGGRCRAQTRANRSRPRCTRYVTVGSLRRNGLAGPNSLTFSGRVNGRALRSGSYRLTLRARDAAGNRSAPRTVAFTVVG